MFRSIARSRHGLGSLSHETRGAIAFGQDVSGFGIAENIPILGTAVRALGQFGLLYFGDILTILFGNTETIRVTVVNNSAVTGAFVNLIVTCL